eukprot:Sspe_Gene.65850::Locus_38939_Transcript_1_1_Confidence_1.000_Length_2034::g.65850::m.65850/K19751/DNAAF2, KTU, PF13; dynein assembly factor 2, axonemal
MVTCPELPGMTTIDMTKKQERVEMTPEEIRRFRECMKDEKFVQLWKEYADEISDPKHLKEQEEYLQQVEREAKEAGDHSFTFIFPKPNFCVRLVGTKKHKVFINICDSVKMDEPVEETTGDTRASNWSVPISLGKPRDEVFNEKPVKVFDACFHPKATFLTRSSDRFMVFLVEIAVEHINAAYEKELGEALPFEFKRLTEVPAVGTPAAQTLRIKAVAGKEGELVLDLPKKPTETADPKECFKGDTGFADRLKAGMGDAAAKERVKKTKEEARRAEEERKRKEEEAREAERLKAEEEERERKRREAEARKEFARNLSKGFVSEARDAKSQGKVPKYSIVHQQGVGYEDCWNETEQVERKLPKNIIFKAEFPDIAKASELNMDIEPQAILIKAEKQGYDAHIKLPLEVNPDSASAKFDKTKKTLTVTLPVIRKRSEFEQLYAEEKRRKREEFQKAAAQQAEEERLEKEEKLRKEREEREKKLEEERKRREEEDARRREVEEAMERAAEMERQRRLEEERKREEEIQRKEEEARRRREEELKKKMSDLEATKRLMEEEEEGVRRQAEQEYAKMMRKINKEVEAAKLADRMAHVSKRKQEELPLTNPFIFQLD